MANTAKLGLIWKAIGWGDGEPVPRVTLPDGTKAEGMAALTYGYDGAVFQKLLVDGSGNLKVVSAGGGSAVSIADAADTVEGALADAAIITDTTGTVNGKLRGLVKWAFERMPASLGQKTMASSLPVVIASDQSGITANAGTNLNTSALALDSHLTDGTQKAIARGGAKGATTAADLTGTAEGADHQALDVQVYHGGTAKDPTAIRALTTADAVNVGQWIGSATPTVGQKAMAASIPIVVASDQSALPVASHPVTNAGTFAVQATVSTIAGGITPGTTAALLGKAEDAVAGSGDTGVLMLGVRNDLLASQTSANLDYGAPALDTNGAQFVRAVPTTNIGTTISATNAAVTLTLAAPGAGLFHYITHIEILNVCTSAIAGTATLAYTTTNLPGSLAWTWGNALAAGQALLVVDTDFSHPIKASAAATATTIVAPALGLTGFCRITAYYYIAP